MKTDLTTLKVTAKSGILGMWYVFIDGISVTKIPLPDVLDVADALEIPIDAGSHDAIRKVNKQLVRLYVNLSPPDAVDTKNSGIVSSIKSPLVAGVNLNRREVT